MLSPLDHVIVWDLETVPDLPCVARVNGFDEQDEAAAREALGEKFPKLIFHKIVCIGALIADRVEGVWIVRSLGAPSIAERAEGEIIQSFVDRIAEYRPQLVTFNGSSFDLPVLRYRAMINRVGAPGLAARNYWNRYTEDALDLCDALASFTSNGKTSLNDLCRALGFPGKPDDIDGGEVERYVREGRIGDVANYCEIDVASTYRVWLVHELFRGRLSPAEFQASEDNLMGFLQERVGAKLHLQHLFGSVVPDARMASQISATMLAPSTG
jgi:3'-5' exonuclease